MNDEDDTERPEERSAAGSRGGWSVGRWLALNAMANESSYVKDPRRARRLVIRDVVLAIIAMCALVGDDTFPDPWGTICALTVGGFLGMGLLPGVRRAVAYRSGWLDGRAQMVAALDESVRRGMTPGEWLRGELARDYAVMGITCPPDLDEEAGP